MRFKKIFCLLLAAGVLVGWGLILLPFHFVPTSWPALCLEGFALFTVAMGAILIWNLFRTDKAHLAAAIAMVNLTIAAALDAPRLMHDQDQTWDSVLLIAAAVGLFAAARCVKAAFPTLFEGAEVTT